MEPQEEQKKETNPWQVEGAENGYNFGFDMEEFENLPNQETPDSDE